MKYIKIVFLFFLWVSLSFQILFIFILKTSIPIPEYLAQKALSESDLFSFKINNANIIEGSKLDIGRVSISSNMINAIFHNTVISLTPNKTKIDWANAVSECKIDNIRILSNQFDIEIKNINLKLINGIYHLHCNLQWHSKFIKLSIAFVDFPDITSESETKINLKVFLDKLYSNLVLFDKYFSDGLIEAYTIVKKGNLFITCTSNCASISLKNNNVFYAMINEKGNGERNYKGKLKSYSNSASFRNFVINSGESLIDFDFDICQGTEVILNDINKLSITDANIDGPIFGKLPEISVNLFKENKNMIAYFYGDCNLTDYSLFVELPFRSSVTGFLNLHPSNSNLIGKMAYGETALFDGEILKLSCHRNIVPINDFSPTLFNIHASSFSVLDTKPGMYSLNGEIDSNMSVFINYAYGKFGGSKATGSYTQQWNPPSYRFLLDGHCLPTDITPWLGTWWGDIWHDFTFSGNSPAGNFSISGVWGGPTGNSLTHGFVTGGNFAYKNVEFFDSNVEIVVKNSYTNIFFKTLEHKFGKIFGDITFSPRSILQPYLEFDGYGQFPFNDGKSFFDFDLNRLFGDINASVVNFNGEGFISLAKDEDVADYNTTSFLIDFDTEHPIQIKGAPITSLSGEIGRRDGLLHCNFENLILADGSCTLQINEKSAISDLIEMRLNISDARPDLLYNTVFKDWLSENEDSGSSLFIPGSQNSISGFDHKGSVSISLLGIGPTSDPFQFQGTGNFFLEGIDVGQIDFLGGLRKNLGKFNLPMPSDALRFTTLEAPFQIDQGNLTFDNFELKGSLSKIAGNGTFDLTNNTVNLNADLKLLGNIQVPIVRQVLNFADPFSRLSEIHVHGPIIKPSWEILVTPAPLP